MEPRKWSDDSRWLSMGVDDDGALYYMDKESTWKDGDGIKVEIRAIPLQGNGQSDIPVDTSYIYQLWKVYRKRLVYDLLSFRFYDQEDQLLSSIPCQNLLEIDIKSGGVASRVCEALRETKTTKNGSLKERMILTVQIIFGLFLSKLFGVLFGIVGWIFLLLTYFAWKRGWKWWALLPVLAEIFFFFVMSYYPGIHIIIVSFFVTLSILIAMIIYKPKNEVAMPSFKRPQMIPVIREKAESFRTSSPILAYVLAGYVGLALLIFAPYYNYAYARDNGFLKWLCFGEIVATAKATVWPYFLLTSSGGGIPRDFDECMIKCSKNTINERSLFFIRRSCRAFSSRKESNYDRCILENMQGINNASAFQAVIRKCNAR